jgi:hypothetical protein
MVLASLVGKWAIFNVENEGAVLGVEKNREKSCEKRTKVGKNSFQKTDGVK